MLRPQCLDAFIDNYQEKFPGFHAKTLSYFPLTSLTGDPMFLCDSGPTKFFGNNVLK